MLDRQRSVVVAVLAVLMCAVWCGAPLVAGEGEDPVRPPAAPDPPKVKPKYTPLAEGIQHFRGYVVGTVATIDDRGVVVKVTAVAAGKGNRAKDPQCLVGKDTRLLFYCFGNKEGGYTPDAGLVKATRRLAAKGGPTTMKVMAERDECLIVSRIWPGADTDPERPDPPRPQPDPTPDPPRPQPDPRPDPPRVEPAPDPPAEGEKDADF